MVGEFLFYSVYVKPLLKRISIMNGKKQIQKNLLMGLELANVENDVKNMVMTIQSKLEID